MSDVTPDVILAVANLHGTIHELRALLETAVDAWECGMMVTGPDGTVLAYCQAAILSRDWYERAKEVCDAST